MANQASEPLQFHQYASGVWQQVDAAVIIERPVTLTVNGEVWLSLLCTPVDLEALALGFLYNEGLIASLAELACLQVCPSGENVDLWLNHPVSPPTHWRRTSGCAGGLTAASGDSDPAITAGFCLTPERVCSLIGLLFDAQGLYRQVRGVHTSALSDGERLLVVTEDVGRHNTLDKISGHCLLDALEPSQRILLTTGRISSEMLQKAARIGAAVVITRTSPTSLSLRLARQYGITVIGYAHRDRFNVYTCPERIVTAVDCFCTESQPDSSPRTFVS